MSIIATAARVAALKLRGKRAPAETSAPREIASIVVVSIHQAAERHPQPWVELAIIDRHGQHEIWLAPGDTLQLNADERWHR